MNHHPFSPSKLYRLYLCPGSHRMSENMPEVESDAAKEGTRLHAGVKDYLSGYCKFEESEWEEDDLQLIEKCAEFLSGLKLSGEDFFERSVTLKNGEVVVTEGTADLVVLDPPKATIIDWKFGYNMPNETALVFQGYAYAGALLSMRQDIESVDVWFYFPRLNKEFNATVRIADLRGIVHRIELIQKHARADDWWRYLNPSPEACQYCPGAPRCPALKTTVMARLPATGLPAVEDLAAVLERKPMIEKFLEAVTAMARKILEDGGSVKGDGFEYVLEERSGRRKITDPQTAFQLLSEKGVTTEQFMQAVDVSITKLEKAVKPLKLDMLGEIVQRGGGYTAMVRKESRDN